MKKYLMTVMAAVTLGGLFTGCSSDADLSGGNTAEFNILKNYEDAFITRFGQPAANQNWGFGGTVAGTRSGNPGEDVPYTSDAINANANEWADPTPGKTYGGWRVPDPLTPDQKEIVMKYFQANPNLKNEDPRCRHFFVQQVYKGGTTVEENAPSPEQYTAANGTSTYNSDNMNKLTVGQDNYHMNNFNKGDCSVNETVLTNGGNANDGPFHSDQIMLMVNIDDTSCFGYHNSGCNQQKNDKWALVGWETIRKWARDQGIYKEDILNDTWNRSFIGFDFELLDLESSCYKENGNKVYAKFTDGQNSSLQYVWDGTDIIPMKSVEGVADLDITDKFTEIWNNLGSVETNSDGTITYHSASWSGGLSAWLNHADLSAYNSVVVEFAEPTTVSTKLIMEVGEANNHWNLKENQQNANISSIELNVAGEYWLRSVSQIALQSDGPADIKISRIYLKGQEGVEGYGDYLLVDGKQIPFLNTNMDQYGGVLYGGKDSALSDDDMKITKDGKVCFNMAKIKELVDDGYLPLKNKDLRTWVKWQGGDGYYSDWIVTLTKAERIDTPPSDPGDFICRVIAEDLTVDQNTDFDFNDVVFDVYSKGVIRIRACGGTLPLRVDGQEVHGLFGKETGDMINTGWNGVSIDYENTYRDIKYSGGSIANTAAANGILVEVQKQSGWIPLDAPVGEVASKIAVGNNYEWCRERQDIDSKWHLRSTGYKPFSDYVKGIVIGNEWYEMVIREAAKYQNKGNQ